MVEPGLTIAAKQCDLILKDAEGANQRQEVHISVNNNNNNNSVTSAHQYMTVRWLKSCYHEDLQVLWNLVYE